MDMPVSAPDGGGLAMPALLPPAPTAAAATAMIWAATDLTDGQKRKLSTAINCAVKALRPGEDPKLVGRHVLMDCATLGPLLRRTAAQLGMTEERFTSLCSEWRRVLRYFGQHEPDRRGQALASPELQAFLNALPEKHRHALVDFFRAIDAARKALHGVCQGFYEDYLSGQDARTLRRKPGDRPKQIALSWNWARKHIPGWPPIELIVPPRRPRINPAGITAYPASLGTDLDKYCNDLSCNDTEAIFLDDIFSEGADSVPRRGSLKPATIRNVRWLLIGVADALVLEGLDRGELRTLRDLVWPEVRPRTAIRHYMNKFSGTPSTMPLKIAEELRLLARDHCGLPKEFVAKIASWSKKIRKRTPKQMRMTPKNKQRLRALMQPLPYAMLINLPEELMRRAKAEEKKKQPNLADAARYAMYAAALEILLICPLRRKNLAGLRLDAHLHRPDPGKGKITHIFLPAGEVKNNEEIEWEIPTESARLIETYVRHYRPLHAEAGSPFLFPGCDNRSRHPQGIAKWICKTVAREIGVEFNMHLARHFAAWNYLRRYPGQYEIVRQALGHKDIETTRRYYLGLERDAVARRIDSVVIGDRRATRKFAAEAFRKGRGGLGPRRKGR